MVIYCYLERDNERVSEVQMKKSSYAEIGT